MLVLSRKRGERVHIGENIVVEVIQLRRGAVRLGICCPREIPVMREELLGAELWRDEPLEGGGS